MRSHRALVPVVALLAAGCSSEPADAGATSTTPPTERVATEPATPDATPKVENFDANQAAELLAADDAVVILDIRTPAEFERGHLADAVNIDYRADDFGEKLAELDREKTYLVH